MDLKLQIIRSYYVIENNSNKTHCNAYDFVRTDSAIHEMNLLGDEYNKFSSLLFSNQYTMDCNISLLNYTGNY